jgi:hypothetical protein
MYSGTQCSPVPACQSSALSEMRLTGGLTLHHQFGQGTATRWVGADHTRDAQMGRWPLPAVKLNELRGCYRPKQRVRGVMAGTAFTECSRPCLPATEGVRWPSGKNLAGRTSFFSQWRNMPGRGRLHGSRRLAKQVSCVVKPKPLVDPGPVIYALRMLNLQGRCKSRKPGFG